MARFAFPVMSLRERTNIITVEKHMAERWFAVSSGPRSAPKTSNISIWYWYWKAQIMSFLTSPRLYFFLLDFQFSCDTPRKPRLSWSIMAWTWSLLILSGRPERCSSSSKKFPERIFLHQFWQVRRVKQSLPTSHSSLWASDHLCPFRRRNTLKILRLYINIYATN